MKSTSCKYVLEKVMKFEKKYAKIVPKSNEIGEKDNLFKNDDTSVSSESLVGSTRKPSSHYLANRDTYKKNNALNLHSSSRHETTSKLSSSSARSSVRATNVSRNGKHDVQEDNFNETRVTNEVEATNPNIMKSDINSLYQNEDNFSLVEGKRNSYTHKKDHNEVLANEIDEEFHRNGVDLIGQNNITIISSDKSEYDISEILESVEVSEEQINESRVQMNLNLNFDENCDEISDTSRNILGDIPLENADSPQNLSLHFLTFEDLIAAEELQSNIKESSENSSIRSKLDKYSCTTQDNSRITSFLAEDKFSHNSNIFESKETDGVSKILFEMEYPKKSKTKSENIDELDVSTNEEEIDEDIEEEIENILSENINEVSNQLLTASNNSEDLSEVITSKRRASVTINSDNGKENVSETDHLSDNHYFNEEIPDFGAVWIRDINNDSLLVPENRSVEICQEIEKKDKYHDEKSQIYSTSDNSIHILKLSSHKDNNIHSETTKHDNQHIRYNKEKVRKKENNTNQNFKSLQNNKVSQTKVHNASAQTENFLLLENDNFEKKMDAIMKSAFLSTINANTSQSDFHKVFADHSSSASTSATPLERGFYCALRQQVELTKHFMHAEYNMYLACVTAIKELSATYKPATLHHPRKVQKKKVEKKRAERVKTN